MHDDGHAGLDHIRSIDPIWSGLVAELDCDVGFDRYPTYGGCSLGELPDAQPAISNVWPPLALESRAPTPSLFAQLFVGLCPRAFHPVPQLLSRLA